MKKLTPKEYQEIRSWMHRNARAVDLAVWRFHFEGGNREAVLDELSHYQNADGGFGRGLEADSWNPDSSPYTTLWAIKLLAGIGLSDMGHPMLQGVFRYLESGANRGANGWFFSIPSNDAYAHAPWWTWNEEANHTENIGLTAELSAFALLNAARDSALYQTALGFADSLVERLKSPGRQGDMGVGGYVVLLDAIRQAGLAERYDFDFISQAVKALANNSIERDPANWAHYCVRPSLYVKSPDSVYYPGNEEIVAEELDYLIETRPEGGVWGIPWSWFENYEKYPKEFAISENWWKAVKTSENMLFLRSFGRLEG